MDSLVFETLIPKPMMQHYISLLLKHRRLVLSGPSGTGKSYLTSRLAEYLVDRSAREVTDGIVVTFNMHRQSCKVTQTDAPHESVQQQIIRCVMLSASVTISVLLLFRSSLRICSFISPTWPIKSIGKATHQTYRWLLFWMIFTTLAPSASLSMALSLANITNGKLRIRSLKLSTRAYMELVDITYTVMLFLPSALTSSERAISR